MKKRVKCTGTDDSSDSDPMAKKGDMFQRESVSSNENNFADSK